MTIYSDLCRLGHKKVCKRGKFFDCCGKYRQKAGGTTFDNLDANHVCGDTCRKCHEELTGAHIDKQTHQCKLKKYIPPTSYQNIGFINFMYEDLTGSNCFNCYDKKCEFHTKNSENELFPALCQVYVPTSQFDFEVTEISKYFPISINNANASINKKFKDFSFFKKNVRVFPTMHEELQKKSYEGLNMLQQLLKFFVSNKIANTTFLCYSPKSILMTFLVRMFATNGIPPKVVQTQNDIKLIELTSIKLKFVNLFNFLPEQKEKYFFPTNIIHSSSIEKNTIPTLNDFYCINDKESLKEEKKLHFNTLNLSEWDFYENMRLHLFQQTTRQMKNTYVYLSWCYSHQLDAFKEHKKEFKFFHPFDCSTNTAYIYSLFQILALNDENVFSLPHEFTGIKVKYSQKEAEYVRYLEYKSPDDLFLNAFSPYGQDKRFSKICIPDSVNTVTKHAFFFHGCMWHAHAHPDCPHMQGKLENFLNKNKYEEEIKFEKKAQKLKDESGGEIREVIVEWECIWDQKKATNSDVMLFMANHYVPHPIQRLIPRDACKLRYACMHELMHIYICVVESHISKLFYTLLCIY